MKSNRFWKEYNGYYELHFYRFNNEVVVLKFTPDKKDKTKYWYVCKDLNVTEGDYEFYDSLGEAKEDFELQYEQYLEDQANYYADLLRQWNEE